MKKRNFRKKLALWITLAMVLQMFGGNGFTFASAATKEKGLIQSFSVVTGSAISYYVGGPNADPANDGLTENTPVPTISEVTNEINSGAGGEYTINVLGNVTENREVVIGNGSDTIEVTIQAATGSAIILRDSSYTDGDLFQIERGSVLILGDKDGFNTNQLIIDGGYDSITMTPIVSGRLINIAPGAGTIMYEHTILQNNVGPIAGGVYNRGEFMINGGEIRNNRAAYGGGVNNLGTMGILGGVISSNSSTDGGGIYNNNFSRVNMSGGDISDNVAGDEGGGVYDDGYFIMEGGSISNNTAPSGGGVYVRRYLTLTGDAQIPKGAAKTNDIYNLGLLSVYEGLTAGAKSMALTPTRLNVEYPQIIASNEQAMINSIGIFDLTIPDYELTRDMDVACLTYNGPVETYYINGVDGDDTNDGSILSPYKTIDAALEDNYNEDPYRECTLVLQDRVVVQNEIVISRRVNIVSDGIGTFHPLVASGTLSGHMFLVENGILTLGSEGTEDDLNPLIIKGDGDPETQQAIIVDFYGCLNLYDGAGIEGYEGRILRNDGITNMYGGFIFGNSDDLIMNYSTFNMSGGRIDTHGQFGINNYDFVNMSDGIINGYKIAGIYNCGALSIAGSPLIASNEVGSCSIYQNSNEIYLTGDLAENTALTINKAVYDAGNKILDAETNDILANNVDKFSMLKANYGISKEGKLFYKASIKNYYVDETKGTNGNGSLAAPFNTFRNAVNAINEEDNLGKIILKSDVFVHEMILIEGTVEVVSDGQVRTIYRANDFSPVTFDKAVLCVTGHLTLGNSDNSGSDTNPTLILDGGYLQNPSFTDGLLVVNTNQMDIYSGVVIQNNNSSDYPAEGAALTNTKNLTMHGGIIRNNSGMYGGVYSEVGTFIMNGGSIINNDGYDSSGLYVHYSKATMNGGTIAGNTGFYSGVYLNQGEFTMNGGSISSNISDMSAGGVAGVAVTYDSEFVMNGGTISNNEAAGHRFAGVYVQGKTYSGYIADSLFTQNGGSIVDNTGYTAGVFSDEYAYFKMAGGQVGNNHGVLKGVTVYDSGSFVLGGAATINNGDSVILNDKTGKGIMIESKLNSASSINLTYADLDQTYATLPIPTYIIGDSLICDIHLSNNPMLDSNSYDFTLEDIDKLVLSNPVYAIKRDGKVGTSIQESWISLGNSNNIFYDGTDKKVSVTVRNGSSSLVQDQDYSLFYVNSAGPGSVTLTIRGIGNYAGKIIKSYTVQKYIANKLITANPANQTFKVKDNMTAEQLLASIKPTQAQIETVQGTTMIIPVTWSMTGGSYDPKGGTYTYTGTLQSGMNVDASGLTLTTQIMVVAEGPQGNSTVNAGMGDNVLKITDLTLTAEMLKEAKENGKDIKISICDEMGKERYSWTFTAEDLKNSKQEMRDVNLAINVSSVNSNESLKKLLEDNGNVAQNSLMVSFGHDGVLPGQAGVKLYVGDQPGIKEGSVVYLYHYNQTTGKLDTLPYSNGYVVDKDGYITFDIVHCSDYVLLDKAADDSVITSLKNQITVTPLKATLYLSGEKTRSITLALPTTLEQVVSLKSKTSGSAIGGVVITYSSSDKKIATVDKKGKITAKATGTVTITTKVTLYNGKTKTFKSKITVKK